MTKDFNFSVSPLAASKIIGFKEKGPYFRISVEPGGCFGFQYAFLFEKERQQEDFLLKKNGANILINKVSEPFLQNATLDYKDEMMGSYFFIENPKAQSSCGCKNSFSF